MFSCGAGVVIWINGLQGRGRCGWRLVQLGGEGWCATVTRGLAARLDRFDGRSRCSSLSPSGRPSGWLAAGEGPTATILKGSVQLRESFS